MACCRGRVPAAKASARRASGRGQLGRPAACWRANGWTGRADSTRGLDLADARGVALSIFNWPFEQNALSTTVLKAYAGRIVKLRPGCPLNSPFGAYVRHYVGGTPDRSVYHPDHRASCSFRRCAAPSASLRTRWRAVARRLRTTRHCGGGGMCAHRADADHRCGRRVATLAASTIAALRRLRAAPRCSHASAPRGGGHAAPSAISTRHAARGRLMRHGRRTVATACCSTASTRPAARRTRTSLVGFPGGVLVGWRAAAL